MKQATEYESLLINHQLTGYDYRVISFKAASDLNAHVFAIDVLDMELKTTRYTLGFPAIRKMKLQDKNNKLVPLKDHPCRVNDWNEHIKKEELFWRPILEERKPNEKPRFPGEFIVKLGNGKFSYHRDECSKLKIMDPSVDGGGMQM